MKILLESPINDLVMQKNISALRALLSGRIDGTNLDLAGAFAFVGKTTIGGIPEPGMVMIATADGTYTPAFLTAGTNVTITPGPGSIEIAASGGGGGAPTTATYITQTPDAGLSAEQALSLLTSGLMVATNGTGVIISRSLAAGSSKISISNADGIAGNPTVDVVEANLTLSNLGGSVTDAQVPNTITLDNITQITTRSHASLQNLSADDHTQYALLAGRAGGQTLKGGTAAGEDLTLMSTNNVTKGNISFGTSTYDEVNNRLGVTDNAPIHTVSLGAGTGDKFALYSDHVAANFFGFGIGAGELYGKVSDTGSEFYSWKFASNQALRLQRSGATDYRFGVGDSATLQGKIHISQVGATRDGSWDSAIEINTPSAIPAIIFSDMDDGDFAGIIALASSSGNTSNQQLAGLDFWRDGNAGNFEVWINANVGTTDPKQRLFVDSTCVGVVGDGWTTQPQLYPLEIRGWGSGTSPTQVHISPQGSEADSGAYISVFGASDVHLSGGAAYESASGWRAKDTEASLYVAIDGLHRWYGNTGLIAGNLFGPTQQAELGATGIDLMTGSYRGKYATGSFTVLDGYYCVIGDQLILSGSEEASLAGDATLTII